MEQGMWWSKISLKKSLRAFLFLLLFSLQAHAQLEGANWYFGTNAGLNFDNCSNPTALTNGMLITEEGCAAISDSEGNLLFYTDGSVIYNANHQLMQNGTGLLGDFSSTQSAIIVPDPGNDDRYYVFAVDYQGNPNGLTYSIVEMTLDNGLGGVLPNQKNTQLTTPVTEKLTAVYHSNNEDIWVIAHGFGNNEYLAYLVTSTGVNAPVISAVGDIHYIGNHGWGATGYLKASPDGTKLACAKTKTNTGLELFSFNSSTGIVSNAKKISNINTYGVEFSPNSKILYATFGFSGGVYQYDLNNPNIDSIQNSETIISSKYMYSALQLGIDGKLYVAAYGHGALSVINQPNTPGVACDFEESVVDLGGKESQLGLPPFITSYFQYDFKFEDLCEGDATAFWIETWVDLTSANWDFGDPDSGTADISTDLDPSHVFSGPGIYTVSVELQTFLNCDPITLTREVHIYPRPELNQPENMVQCGIDVFDLSQIVTEMLGEDQNAADYTINYYKNQTDADAGIPGTEITNPKTYVIETMPQQEIYVRVENEFGCYDTVGFKIRVNPTPVVDLSTYDGMAICVDLDPSTPVIGGNYELITIDTGLSETDYIFNWSLNGEPLPETGSSVLADVPGEYSVVVTDITSTDPSCVATSSATILQSNPPEFDVKPVFFEGEIIISNVTGNGDYEFSTDQVSWVDFGENTSLTLKVKNTGLVTVYGHDKNGCGTTVVEVWMIDYMKFFTPNQDGFNDRWRILGLPEQSEANIYIFDRYGKLLASLDPSGLGWDGIYNGHPMPANDYWFRLEYKSPEGTPRVFQENFSLIR